MEGERYGIALGGRKVLAKDVRMPADKHPLHNWDGQELSLVSKLFILKWDTDLEDNSEQLCSLM